MTRKHYIAMANRILFLVNQSKGLNADDRALYLVGVGDSTHAMADAFQADNAAFSRTRFIDACGLGVQA
jgi:hypothetical protein